MRTTYIVSGAQLKSFQDKLIKEHGVLLGTQVLPFFSACVNSNRPQEQLEIEAFKRLSTHDFSLLAASFKSPSLTASLISFYYELQCYGLTLKNLPRDTQRAKELFTALSLIHDLLPKLSVPEGTVYYDANGLTHAQCTYLESHQALPIQTTHTTPSHIEVYEALNFRQELEGALQYILEHKLTNATLALFNLQSVAPYVEAVFKRYKMPLKLQNRTFDVVKHQFEAWLDYFAQPSLPTIQTLIAANAFGLKEPYKLLTYIKHFNLTFKDLSEPFNYAEVSDLYLVKDILDLQNSIQEDSIILKNMVDYTASLTLKEGVVYALNQLNQLYPTQVKPLMRYVQTIYPYIERDTLVYIKHQLSKLTDYPKQFKSVNVVDVSSITQNIEGPLFILGMTSKAYPNLSSKTGVLDEHYLKGVNGYPSLEKRNQYALTQKRRIFSVSDTLILSFPHATYEGKGFEAAYELEVLMKEQGLKKQTWVIHESLVSMTRELKLSERYAQQLYLEDGLIKGSVSSFELYVKDPLSFFLKFGLKLTEPATYQLDQRLFGTLNHSFFERSLNHKDTNLWSAFESYLPRNDALLELIKTMNQSILSLHLDIMNAAISTTDFKPYDFEKRFEDVSLFKGISFKGVIDRVDFSEDMLMIVDYKSSAHSLNQEQIRLGETLQLLTYALVAQKLYHRPVQGVFYYNLTRNTLSLPTKRYSKSKGVLEAAVLTEDDMFKNQSYSGWFFEEPGARFTNASHYTGLMYRSKDDSYYIYQKPYDINRVRDYLTGVYEVLREGILTGIMDNDALNLPLDSTYVFKKGSDDDASV